MTKEFLLNYWPWLFIGIFGIFIAVEYRRYRQEKQALHQAGYNRPSIPNELVLKRTAGQLSPQQMKIFLAALLFVSLALIGILLSIVIKDNPDQSYIGILEALGQKVIEKPTTLLNILMPLLFMIVYPIMQLAMVRNEQLVLTKEGICYHSLFKGLLSHLKPGWQLTWSEIESITFNSRLARGQVRIKPKRGNTQTLIAHTWQPHDEFPGKQRQSLFTRLQRERELQSDTVTALEQLPLLRYIQEIVGFTIDTHAKGDLDYDLSKNPHTRLLLIILFAVLAYAIVDTVANQETYIALPHIAWFITIGIVVTLASVHWLSDKQVPKSNIWGLSILFGLIVAISLYPALLRLNQLTDAEGLKEYTYRYVSPYRFEPVMDKLPVIDMPVDEYWLSIPLDEEVVFKLRRGAFDFYQIDMAPEYTKMRHWYCLQRAKDNPEKIKKCDEKT